jgi:hypothetical protein
MLANMGPSGNCETNTGPDVASFRVMLQVLPGQASEGLLQHQQQNKMNRIRHTNKVHIVNLPQNVGPCENYKRCEGCVFLWAGGGVGPVNFGNLATEKKKKMGTSPHVMRGKNYIVTIL